MYDVSQASSEDSTPHSRKVSSQSGREVDHKLAPLIPIQGASCIQNVADMGSSDLEPGLWISLHLSVNR